MNRLGSGPVGSAAAAAAAAGQYRVCGNCRKVPRQEKRVQVSPPLTRGPSAFIPENEVMQANGLDERTNLLVEEYSTSGRLDNITQVMSIHTQYLESFLRSQFYMLRMDGPLPLPYRHYIAIMIADSLSELEALMERMKRLQEDKEDEEASQEEMATRFEKEKKESLLVISGAFDDEIVSTDVSRYVEDPGFGYKDFARRGEDHLPTFRAQDYTWENHGFSLVNRLYSDIGHLLDEKFRMVYNLTYNTMATHEDVDTTTLRRALFNYVHCMYGIRYDDYDYGEVNQLLERSLKVYIKTVTCYPERTTKRMYDSYWRQFKHSEKVHVNLLLMEARMQAELLYALRAITRHLT
ncbi:sestrin-3 isoform X3 [Poecile atricapillus]|uniref:sestrin-3 isoform X3 n=1 Tax=Poecile atricapillus TaxID=48891 RepID=UPI0027394742|nr:sestrin-3 isoform X3 [Poecile atricapillus]